ncbi:coiled-coil domain-containing protein 96 [Hoplias malabaricus]|uniref:coiled-coil domain-containing protein 96 n=1 Tax=Hoplias malabaricus TaxID=27720 RepID=UPI0034635F0F
MAEISVEDASLDTYNSEEMKGVDSAVNSKEANVSEVSTDPEEVGKAESAAGEHSDTVPVNCAETDEPLVIGEESENAMHLSDQRACTDLPTSETFEEGEAPDVELLIGEHHSQEDSVKPEDEMEDDGLLVLDTHTPEPENLCLEDKPPPDLLEKEKHDFQVNYEEMLELLQDLQMERDKLSYVNSQLQVKLADYFHKKMGQDLHPERENVINVQQQCYQKYLDMMEGLKWQQLHDLELHQQQEEEQKRQSQEKLEQLQQEWRAQQEVEYKLIVAALTKMLGKQAAQTKAEQLQQAEQKKQQELVTVRLENIKLKIRMEPEMKAGKKLIEGWHPIDIEQLKIENQTYNEKIEERNEELLKLRRKITNTVQVLTHVKNKLQFVQTENQMKQAELSDMNAALSRKQDVLTQTKQARDALRADNLHLRQTSGLLGNKPLLRDFEQKVDTCESLEAKLETLKRRHAELTLKCAGVKKKLEQSRTMDH